MKHQKPLLLSLWLLLPLLSSVDGAFGGHDVFTSLAQLRQLWRSDRDAVARMELAADNLESMSRVLRRYARDHRALSLHESDPNFSFLGHPLNAYLLVRHVALGWEEVRTNVFQMENDTRQIFGKEESRSHR